MLARSLCAARERVTIPLARLAASLCREQAWSAFGFARVADFALEYLGRSGRWLRDLAALHAALAALPGLDAALTGSDGGAPLGRVRALLVGRAASPGTLPAWIALARRLSVRALREEVARERLPCQEDNDEGDDRVLVRIPAPAAIVAAFDEAVDLYRAVEGSETSATSLIEALVAEASAGEAAPGEARFPGARSPDADLAALRHDARPSIVEGALARSTGNWSHLPRGVDATWGLGLGRSTLRRLGALDRAGDAGSPSERVERMLALLSVENELEIRLGRLLATMGDDRAWVRLRFAGAGHYAEERLGLSRTAARARARASHLLARFPRLREAYQQRAVGLEAALIVGRILDDDGAGGAPAEREWVRHAREVTVKRLRDEARAIRRGRAFGGAFRGEIDHPGAEGACGDVGATRGDAGAILSDSRTFSPGSAATVPLSDAEWHASLRREPGTARRRVALLGMIALGARTAGGADRTWPTPGSGHPSSDASFSPSTARLPRTDVFLRLTLPYDLAGEFLDAVERARARCAREAEAIRWDAEPDVSAPTLSTAGVAARGCGAAGADGAPMFSTAASQAARMFSIACRRVPSWVGLLALLEDFVETWDSPERAADLPPDPIFVRDGWRCAAPACTARRNLEDHHVRYRSRGGGDGARNRVCLCRFHHQRGEHGGLASCRGSAPLGLAWRLGRRDLGRWYRNERRVEAPP